MRGLRVLELAGSPAGAYCGRLFATAGADVVVVEPADGAPTRRLGPWVVDVAGERRSATHEYLAAGKRSVVLDDADVDAAYRWADIVIGSFDGNPDGARAHHDRVAAADPSTVDVVLSGFGLTGPYVSWRTSPLVDWASGGYLYLTGEPDREPLQGGGPWAAYLHGATAAIGAQAAALHAARTGEGQLVDVGAMESVAAAHQWSLTMYTHTGAVKGRWGRRFGESFHPMGPYQTGDGEWIAVGAASRDQWDNFCITTDTVELLADDSLYSAPSASSGARRSTPSSPRGSPRAPPTRPSPPSRSIGSPPAGCSTSPACWNPSSSPPAATSRPARTSAPAASCPDCRSRSARPPALDDAPDLGADTVSFTTELAAPPDRAALPSIDLRATRLLEFGIAWAGPLAARTLGDLGVDVIKVEHPMSRGFGTGGGMTTDLPWRWGQLGPPPIRAEIFPGAEPGARRWNRMGTWNKMNRSKRSCCLDAKPAEGAAVLEALIASADMVVHNYTPRGARSLGIDPEHLRECNDRVASVAMTGYGETGPMSTHSSYGPMLEAHAGFAAATGYVGEEPLRIGLAFPDAVGGLHGAFAAAGRTVGARADGRSRARRSLAVGDVARVRRRGGARRVHDRGSTGAPRQPLRRPRPAGRLPLRRHRRLDRRHGPGRRRVARRSSTSSATTCSWRSPTRITPRRAAAHDEIDAALGRWTRASTARGGQGAAGDRRRREPGVHEPRPRARRPPRGRGFIVEWDHADVGRQRYPGSPFHFARTR